MDVVSGGSRLLNGMLLAVSCFAALPVFWRLSPVTRHTAFHGWLLTSASVVLVLRLLLLAAVAPGPLLWPVMLLQASLDALCLPVVWLTTVAGMHHHSAVAAAAAATAATAATAVPAAVAVGGGGSGGTSDSSITTTVAGIASEAAAGMRKGAGAAVAHSASTQVVVDTLYYTLGQGLGNAFWTRLQDRLMPQLLGAVGVGVVGGGGGDDATRAVYLAGVAALLVNLAVAGPDRGGVPLRAFLRFAWRVVIGARVVSTATAAEATAAQAAAATAATGMAGGASTAAGAQRRATAADSTDRKMMQRRRPLRAAMVV